MDDILKNLRTLFEKDSKDLSILGKLVKVAIIIILMSLAIKVFNKIIDKFLQRRKKIRIGIDEKKANTLSTILKNINKYIFYFVGVLAILELFGIHTTSLLATAGIGGLAIGFGAQSLVKDVITGFFILFEDQFNVGDYIQTGDFEGIVEEIGVRVIKIRDFSGDLHIIPNSSIGVVTNKTTGSMRASVNVSISYEEDINKVIGILENVCREVKNSLDGIVEGPTVLGVTDLGEYGVVLTVVAKTKPMEQWNIEREIRKRIKEAFDREGIEIPYPKMVVLENDRLRGSDGDDC